MLVDDHSSVGEPSKTFTSLTEFNRHLESALPEVYLDDIYKYLRDCEVSICLLSLVNLQLYLNLNFL